MEKEGKFVISGNMLEGQAGKVSSFGFNSREPTAAAADSFLAAVKEPANSPMYIHCATANRVGAVWLIKRVLVDGWDVGKATAEAERIGLRSPHLKQFAIDYIAAHPK